MDDSSLPKKILFGWLPQCRPQHGTKLRWRDRKDMKKFGIDESGWFAKALDRGSILAKRMQQRSRSLHEKESGIKLSETDNQIS